MLLAACSLRITQQALLCSDAYMCVLIASAVSVIAVGYMFAHTQM